MHVRSMLRPPLSCIKPVAKHLLHLSCRQPLKNPFKPELAHTLKLKGMSHFPFGSEPVALGASAAELPTGEETLTYTCSGGCMRVCGAWVTVRRGHLSQTGFCTRLALENTEPGRFLNKASSLFTLLVVFLQAAFDPPPGEKCHNLIHIKNSELSHILYN